MESDKWLLVVGVITLLVLVLWVLGMDSAHPADINIDVIAIIESGGNPDAYNKDSGAIGLCQITPACLTDWKNRPQQGNRALDESNAVIVSDLFDARLNWRLADWYLNIRIPQMLRTYKIDDTIDNRLWAYNAGIGKVKKGIKPKETRKYIIKYYKLMGR